MRSLGDGDASSGALADLGDLAASTSDDASNHVSWDADVLSLNVLAILGLGWWRWTGRWVGGAPWVGRRNIAEVGTVTSAVEGPATSVAAGCSTVGKRTTSLDSDGWVVEDSAIAALLVVYEALANLPDSLLNALWVTLNLDNALGGLWEHLFLRNHANGREILNLLDLKTLTADDCTHLVVGDEEADG